MFAGDMTRKGGARLQRQRRVTTVFLQTIVKLSSGEYSESHVKQSHCLWKRGSYALVCHRLKAVCVEYATGSMVIVERVKRISTIEHTSNKQITRGEPADKYVNIGYDCMI
jgi:hypothetical protein